MTLGTKCSGVLEGILNLFSSIYPQRSLFIFFNYTNFNYTNLGFINLYHRGGIIDISIEVGYPKGN